MAVKRPDIKWSEDDMAEANECWLSKKRHGDLVPDLYVVYEKYFGECGAEEERSSGLSRESSLGEFKGSVNGGIERLFGQIRGYISPRNNGISKQSTSI